MGAVAGSGQGEPLAGEGDADLAERVGCGEAASVIFFFVLFLRRRHLLLMGLALQGLFGALERLKPRAVILKVFRQLLELFRVGVAVPDHRLERRLEIADRAVEHLDVRLGVLKVLRRVIHFGFQALVVVRDEVALLVLPDARDVAELRLPVLRRRVAFFPLAVLFRHGRLLGVPVHVGLYASGDAADDRTDGSTIRSRRLAHRRTGGRAGQDAAAVLQRGLGSAGRIVRGIARGHADGDSGEAPGQLQRLRVDLRKRFGGLAGRLGRLVERVGHPVRRGRRLAARRGRAAESAAGSGGLLEFLRLALGLGGLEFDFDF